MSKKKLSGGGIFIIVIIIAFAIAGVMLNVQKPTMKAVFGGWPCSAANSVIGSAGYYNCAGVLSMSNGRINNTDIIWKMQDLGANAYVAILTNSRVNDYNDFKQLLIDTKDKDIDLYVWLYPPYWNTTQNRSTAVITSEQCSSPYKCDFVKWFEELSTLSLSYPNLKGAVIDDFLGPWKWFDSEYVEEFVSKGKSINPNFKFYPVVYSFQFNDIKFAKHFENIDAIVFPYYSYYKTAPRANHISIEELEPQIKLFNFLWKNDNIVVSFMHPPNSFTRANSSVEVEVDISSFQTDEFKIYFRNKDYGHLRGYIIAEMKLDDEIVYKKDLIEINTNRQNLSEYWNPISLNTKGHTKLLIKLTNAGGSLYNYVINFDVIMSKVNYKINNYNGNWTISVADYFKDKSDIKMIGMPYAWKLSFADDTPTPAYVQNVTKIFLDYAKKDGNMLGVMMYVVPMNNRSIGSTYNLVKDLFKNE